MIHAVRNSLAVEDAGEDPDRWLVIGPDCSGNFLEVIVVVTSDRDEIIVHAMPMRPQYRRFLNQ
jgi:hypothetical protein